MLIIFKYGLNFILNVLDTYIYVYFSHYYQWLLDNNIDELDLGLTFSVETDVFGVTEVIELQPNGDQIIVNDENKVRREGAWEGGVGRVWFLLG